MGSQLESKRVCIIGAGVVGLLAIKHIKESEGLIVGTVFEQMDRIGGLWHYVKDTKMDVNQLPVHTAVYPGLSANVAKEFLEFQDFDFPDYENGSSYLSHRSIERYLQEYAEKFKLLENIQLNTRVLCVRPTNPVQSDTKWRVQLHNYNTNSVEEHIFDAVIVGNGKFFDTLIPEIDGIKDFEGQILHTKFYREPEAFRGQHVVIFGLGPSAVDIGREISEVTDHVTISHRTPFEIPSKKVTIVKSSIVLVKKKSVVLENGDEIPCDSLLLATGYHLSYPFLHPDCGITIEKGKYVTPLYKNMLSIKYPTLCFPNLFLFAPEWIVSDIQMHYFMKYLRGQVALPMETDRWRALEAQENEWNSKNIPQRHRLRLGAAGEEVYPYLESLAQDGGFTHVIRNLALKRKCLFINLARLFGHVEIFRNDRVRWTGPNSASYYCYSGPECGDQDHSQEEHLTLQLDERTGEVSITSSLGKVRNGPLGNL